MSTTATIRSPTLSTAQIMADLDSLTNCDPTAATNLLRASKTLSPGKLRRRSRASILPEPPKFDNLGKRIVPPILTPTISRINSESSTSRRGSGNSLDSGSSGKGTPAGMESPYEKDEDMRRAKELMELFEKKEGFRQMGTAGLGRAKENVDEVVQRYTEKYMEEKQRVATTRHLGAK